MDQPEISVVIPTFRRPESLRRAIASVLAQTGLDRSVELVVVDNDPDGSAALAVRGVQGVSPVSVVYVRTVEPGVANARNAGVAA